MSDNQETITVLQHLTIYYAQISQEEKNELYAYCKPTIEEDWRAELHSASMGTIGTWYGSTKDDVRKQVVAWVHDNYDVRLR